ncbi:hypothetical protein N0V82_001131 [Gnomoniopsis sp. IMI 355080]|nr:hypothetical protein N0V82_001131 [Gnomoniopsis sp. IMI 355080]
MNPIPQVLHRTATPVSVIEFLDALYATCPPRFPGARAMQRRTVGLAVSGGVDSMALAYLCARSQVMVGHTKVADTLTSEFRAFIFDHKLRQGSDQEALAVQESLKSLGLRAQIISSKWADILAHTTGYSYPNELPNVETLARRMRYRRFATICVMGHMTSLLLAHHQDDQYETVLMRLLSGHGRAGLLGMRAASDIPESHDIHGAYQSGFVDDQMSHKPYLSYRPSGYQVQDIRRQMMAEMDPDAIARERREGSVLSEEDFDAYVPQTQWLLPAEPPRVEDGGIMIYRPLLEFSKDRLIATCEAAGVPWFEDATNSDPTLTMRNAVRYLYKNHTLPRALQKPAILELSNRLKAQVALDEAEANRLLARTVIRNFDPVAGTVVVQLPSFRLPRLRKGHDNKARRERRLEHNRRIAAILLKKIIAIVTPEVQGGFASNLQNSVLRLFPSLNDRPSDLPAEPKPFNVSSVHFVPIRTSKNPKEPVKWYLTREPYVSGRSPPQCDFARLKLRRRYRRRPDQWRWPEYTRFQLWDGRFWVQISNRSPVHAAVAPFQLEHAKAFRDALPDGKVRDELMTLLKLHAPGKVRWTLPAIYTAGDHLAAIADHVHVAELEKAELMSNADAEAKWRGEPIDSQYRKAYAQALRCENEPDDTKYEQKYTETDKASKGDERILVALPSLGIAIPGLSNWIKYEVRYKRVDRRILDRSMGHESELEWLQKARRRRETEDWRTVTAGKLIYVGAGVESDALSKSDALFKSKKTRPYPEWMSPLRLSRGPKLAVFVFCSILLVLFIHQTDPLSILRPNNAPPVVIVASSLSEQGPKMANSSTAVDLGWYAPAQTLVNNLTNVASADTTGVYGFIYNTSNTPDELYGQYNWCNMPHVRASEYITPSDEYELVYVELIHRHHKRTPYAANSFPVESYTWDCNDQGLYYFAAPFSANNNTSANPNAGRNASAEAYWSGTSSVAGFTNPFEATATGFKGTCQFPQITAPGLDDSWQHGVDLYGVYGELLGFLPAREDASWRDKVQYRVTNNVITSEVAGMVVNGMWGTTDSVPLLIQPTGVDSLEPSYTCASASAQFDEIESSSNAAWEAHLEAGAALWAELDGISGVAPDDADFHVSFDHYYDNLSARQCHGKPLPCKLVNVTNANADGTVVSVLANDTSDCVTQAEADAVYRFGNWEYSQIYRDAGPATLAASVGSLGVWIAELAAHLKAVVAGDGSSSTTTRTIWFHNVAHDGSVSRLLGILQAEVMVWPGMGSEVVFELWRKSGGGAGAPSSSPSGHYVRVLWGGRVLNSSNPSLGRLDMLPVETLLAYFDGLAGVNATLIVDKCNAS